MRIQKQWLSLIYCKSNVFNNNPGKLHNWCNLTLFFSENKNATSLVSNFCRDIFVVTPRCYYGNSMALLW